MKQWMGEMGARRPLVRLATRVSSLLFPISLIGFVLALATTLIYGIVVRGPDTHANLWNSVRGYSRTDIDNLTSEPGPPMASLPVVAPPVPGATPVPTPTKPADPARGEVFFRSMCSGCHGKAGEGTDTAPALNTPDFAEKFPADSAIVYQVRNGRGMMQAFAWPSDDEVADGVAYVRSLQ